MWLLPSFWARHSQLLPRIAVAAAFHVEAVFVVFIRLCKVPDAPNDIETKGKKKKKKKNQSGREQV